MEFDWVAQGKLCFGCLVGKATKGMFVDLLVYPEDPGSSAGSKDKKYISHRYNDF